MRTLRNILSDCKSLALTAFQISVLLGFSEPDVNADVDIRKFAVILVNKINEMYSIEALRRKSQLCHLGHFKVAHIKMPKYDENVLFAAFRRFDADHNGFLEWNEYQNCLQGLKELGLTIPECYALNLLADISGNGKIDYPEFMKHF